jgi:hypothetical protein
MRGDGWGYECEYRKGPFVKIAYIKWRDAVAEEADGPLAVDRLATLEEIGFFVGESEDAVTIVMEKEERHGAVCPGRWRLHVPKSAIVELRVVDFEKAFAKPRAPRKTKITTPSLEPAA